MIRYRRRRRVPVTARQKLLLQDFRRCDAAAEAIRIGAARLLDNTEPDEEGVLGVLHLIETEVLPKAKLADQARTRYDESFNRKPVKKGLGFRPKKKKRKS